MRRRPSRSRAAVAAGLLGVLALAGCTATPETPAADESSATASPTPTEAPATPATPAPRPRAGDCYPLVNADVLSPTSDTEPVRCRRGHTSATYLVGTLDAFADGHLLAVDSPQVEESVARSCRDRLPGYLGGSADDLRLSMLRPIWFSPTIEQSDGGQDWLRCDVILLARDRTLARFPGTLEGVLADDGWPDRFGMCGTANPASAQFERVVCSSPHSWEAIATVDAEGDRYPGTRRLQDAGTDACESPARAAADDPLTVTWTYEPPTREQWRTGQQYGFCWVPA